jgi:transposase
MEGSSSTTRCPSCGQLRERLAKLDQRVAEQDRRIAQLETQLAAARKNSSNSSKPPSSDIVKPPKDRGKKDKRKRGRGGQPGHPRHERPPFPPEQITETHDYTLDCCPDCGGPLKEADEAPRIVQQVEIQEVPIKIDEHRGLAYWCAKCQQVHYARLPEPVVQAGLAGPNLTALVGFLKGVCHASFSTIRKFLRDVVKVTISRGQLAKLIQKVSASLEATYEELLAALPDQSVLNVDETGHRDEGKRLWTWCFRAPLFTLFRIDPSRGSDVLIDVLGEEFNGLLGCDYFSAYRKYMKDFDVRVQFCLAHLIRDVKFLVEHPNKANKRYGELLLEHLRKLFGVIHRRQRYASETSFRRTLATVRNDLVYDAFMHLPNTREAGNLADRFALHMDSYFRFITEPDLAPTNNVAEQAIRFVAIHRRLTQGTRGAAGQEWCQRMWTVVLTCAQQGRSVFQYLQSAVQAFFQGTPSPSLLPDTT